MATNELGGDIPTTDVVWQEESRDRTACRRKRNHGVTCMKDKQSEFTEFEIVAS